MFPHGTVENDPHRNPHIREWKDLSPKERAETTRVMSERYGVTLQSAAKEHGHLIDAGFRRAAASCPECKTVEAEGQRWYHGGPGTEAREIREFAGEKGISFQAAASMRAVVSPQGDAMREMETVRAAARHVESRKGGGRYAHYPDPAGRLHIKGSQHIQINTQKSAEIYRQAREGVHPHDVEVEASARGERMGQPVYEKGEVKMGRALSGGKVTGYEESYSFPSSARVGAVDVHAARGMTPHLDQDKERDKMLDVNHAHAFFSEAMKRAADQRGLGMAEGQTVAWHELRNYEGVPVERGNLIPQTRQFGDVGAVPAPRKGRRKKAAVEREADVTATLKKTKKQGPLPLKGRWKGY